MLGTRAQPPTPNEDRFLVWIAQPVSVRAAFAEKVTCACCELRIPSALGEDHLCPCAVILASSD